MNGLLAVVLGSVLLGSFEQGETLDYNLTWLKITGGTARMTISRVEGDESKLRITSVGKSSKTFSRIFKVRDEIESTIARDDFSTLRYIKRIDEQGEKKLETTVVENGIATRKRNKVKTVKVPRPVYDPMSLIYYLRTLDLAPGKTYDFSVVADAKLYHVHAVVTRRETIQTPAGTFNTVLVEPRMSSGGVEREEKMFLWYSDDERRIPVRIRTEVNFGAITATLRKASSGAVTSIEPPVLRGQ